MSWTLEFVIDECPLSIRKSVSAIRYYYEDLLSEMIKEHLEFWSMIIYTQRKKETVGWNKVDNSYTIKRINMKIKTHSIYYPHISSSKFYVVSRASLASSLSFYQNISWLFSCRITICNKLNWCKMLVLVAYDTKNTLLCKLLRNNDVTPSRKSVPVRKTTCIELWSLLALFGRFD